uniref:Leucine-rich repeat-containing protein 25 n=1 Tax=Spermophilus dauricus TaxID=99837 RepID=A0A8C9PIU8_SPEDA
MSRHRDLQALVLGPITGNELKGTQPSLAKFQPWSGLWWSPLPLIPTSSSSNTMGDLSCLPGPCPPPSLGEWIPRGTCLNFSGLLRSGSSNQSLLSLPSNQSLRASRLQILDLSANDLRELPPLFFAHLDKLQLLDVTGNRLSRVDGALALHCGLELRADCSCAMLPWHQVWQSNCSGQQAPQCLLRATGAWQNLSAFLEPNCAPGLSPVTIGAIAAGGALFLGLAVPGPLLVWRLQGSRGARNLGPGKAWGAQDGSRPSLGSQPRYSSRSLGTKPPEATLHRISVPDYENIFLDQQGDKHQWVGASVPCCFRGPRQDKHPIYRSQHRLQLSCRASDFFKRKLKSTIFM